MLLATAKALYAVSISMKKIYILGVLALVLFTRANAQKCLSHEMHLQHMASDPRYRAEQEKLEAETQQYMQNKSIQDTTTLIIPVVFHVVHTGGSDNISVAQIRNQIATLNVEFKRLQSDTSLTPAPFKALGGRFNVEFRLATIDPNGNCTNGITRHYSPIATCAEVAEDVKSLVYWPSTKYLNIWLVASMRYDGMIACQGGGYAQFPGGGATTDGIEIRGDLIGSIGTATTNSAFGNWKGRYLIHELGHWFNLRHIWGDATCGNDLISDTPPAFQSNSGCPVFPHNANNSCGSNANGEMTSNYMDYSTGACLNIFTKQQVTRMEAAINGSASGRNNLWKPANLILTGTNTTTMPTCLSVPEMKPYGTKLVCGSGVVSFTDVSYGGTATSRRWNFPGGTSTGSPSDSIINITYSTPGTYAVSLTRKKDGDSATTTYQSKVVVLTSSADAEHIAPVNEAFDNPTLEQWIALNPDGDQGFKRSATTGSTAAGCVTLSNFSNGPGRIDELISPAYNLTGVTGATLKYKLAFAKRSNSNKDKLEVYISSNCGLTWTKRSTFIANNAITGGGILQTVSSNVNSNAFNPSVGSAQWREETIALSASFLVSGFRVKFTFTGSGGNNLYIDDVNITGTPILGNSGLATSDEEIELYPNPTEGELRIRVPESLRGTMEVRMMDVCGKTVKQLEISNIETDGNDSFIDLNGMKPGVYFCSIRRKGASVALKKVLIQ